MPVLIGQNFPGGVLSDAQVQNGVKGKADIPATLGGRSRMLNEYIRGAVATGNMPGCAPPSMMGPGPGHSHAGGADGCPLQHSFGSWSFGQGPQSITDVTNGSAPTASVSAAGQEVIFDGKIYTTFVPMCGPDGAYVAADFSVLVEVTANCTIYARFLNEGFQTNLSHTFSGGGVQRSLIRASGTNKAVRLKPGHYNGPRVRVVVEYTSAAADAALLHMGLHQVSDVAVRG